MSGGRMRKLAVLVIIGGAIAAALKALRGEPTPVYSNHPSVTGGPTVVPTSDDPVESTAVATKPTEAPERPASPVVAAEPAAEATGSQAWVVPVDGGCPDGYPIKAKVKSGIFHQPGTATYDRTKPDRCYASAEAAQADGLRPPKR